MQVLVDTGCSLTMVRADYLEPTRVDTQEKASVRCVHGDSG